MQNSYPKYIIYKTVCVTTGEFYIGKHVKKSEKERRNYLGSGDRLRRLIRKYGRESFLTYPIFEALSELDAYEIEKEIIAENLEDELCINIAHGGVGAMLGRTHSEKTRKLLSEQKMGTKLQEYVKVKMSIRMRGTNNPFYGRKHSEESKRLLSEKQRGRKASPETKAKLSLAHKGRLHTEEAKEKIRQAHLGDKNYYYGKPLPEEHRNKIKEANTGKVRSEEAKKNYSEAAKNRIWITNGQRVSHISRDQEIPEGWKRGKKIT